MSFDTQIDLFMSHLRVERNLSPNTLQAYGRDLQKVVELLFGDADGGTDAVASKLATANELVDETP